MQLEGYPFGLLDVVGDWAEIQLFAQRIPRFSGLSKSGDTGHLSDAGTLLPIMAELGAHSERTWMNP